MHKIHVGIIGMMRNLNLQSRLINCTTEYPLAYYSKLENVETVFASKLTTFLAHTKSGMVDIQSLHSGSDVPKSCMCRKLLGVKFDSS